jgi:hypothetical protein
MLDRKGWPTMFGPKRMIYLLKLRGWKSISYIGPTYVNHIYYWWAKICVSYYWQWRFCKLIFYHRSINNVSAAINNRLALGGADQILSHKRLLSHVEENSSAVTIGGNRKWLRLCMIWILKSPYALIASLLFSLCMQVLPLWQQYIVQFVRLLCSLSQYSFTRGWRKL